MKIVTGTFVMIFLASMVPHAWIFAIESRVGDPPEKILKFGDSLYKEEDYYRAITEYRRFLHLYPDHPKAAETQFLIGFSYLKGKKWDAGIAYFQKLAHSTLGQNSAFALAQTYFLSEKYSFAIDEWNQFLEHYLGSMTPKSNLVDLAYYQKGWAYFLEEKHNEAKKEFSKVKDPTLIDNAHLMTLEISKWPTLPYRSPFLAGFLSTILPGLGQWYDERFWDGTAALLINSMFAYGIYATWRDEHYPTFGILIFLASGFYGGNIFSAVSSAHKFNQNIKESKWHELKTKYGIDLQWNGNSLTFKF